MQFTEISDLGLVTGLMTLGYSPLERRKEGKRVLFVFEDSEEIKKLKDDFYNNRMDVDARQFHMTMKSVKNSIYQMGEDK